MIWQTQFGRCIYVSPSGYKVFQNAFYRWFTFGNDVLQTVINRRNPQKAALHYVRKLTLMARTFPGPTCLLGLGGGAVAQVLHSEHRALTAVDNSEEVIHIAKQFFMLDKLKNVTLIHQNAQDFVRLCPHQYQHMLIDLYEANNFPKLCHTEEFFIQIKKSLKTQGFLAINLANYQEQWPIFQLVKRHFKKTLVIPVKKSANLVLFASSDLSYALFLEQLQTKGELKKVVWMDTWGYVGF